jgi:hypothetical protein
VKNERKGAEYVNVRHTYECDAQRSKETKQGKPKADPNSAFGSACPRLGGGGGGGEGRGEAVWGVAP